MNNTTTRTTNARSQAAWKQRQRESGKRQLTVFVHAEDYDLVRDFIRILDEHRARATPRG